MPPTFLDWFNALETRHTETLTFQEIRRAVQALSSIYVERRDRIDHGAVFAGAGKRAAFGIFFGPLHFLLVREIVRALQATEPAPQQIVDLGCGSGSAGAAWAVECGGKPRLLGIDSEAWAVEESKWTYRTLGLRGIARKASVDTLIIPDKAGIVAAFTINELDKETRQRLLEKLLQAAARGSSVLIVEPIARRLTEWWDEWARRFKGAGGFAEEWRFRVDLPEKLALMDRAAGLNHHELTARSQWLTESGSRIYKSRR